MASPCVHRLLPTSFPLSLPRFLIHFFIPLIPLPLFFSHSLFYPAFPHLSSCPTHFLTYFLYLSSCPQLFSCFNLLFLLTTIRRIVNDTMCQWELISRLYPRKRIRFQNKKVQQNANLK